MLELSKNVDSSCHYEMAKAVSLIISTYFLVAILLCITIFLILLLAVVIYIRRRNDLNKKMDDIRGYIINYEDEEGGNINAGYDLNVPNEIYDAPPLNSESLSGGIQTSGTIYSTDMCIRYLIICSVIYIFQITFKSFKIDENKTSHVPCFYFLWFLTDS